MIASNNKRINERIRQYWEEKKADRPFPLETDINPQDIAAIWDHCFLVTVADEATGGKYLYSYLGQALVEAYGDDFSDKEICERLAYPAPMLLTKFDELCQTKAPVEEESEFTNSKGMLVKFRSCMLPLGKDDTQDVHFILGGMKWKAC